MRLLILTPEQSRVAGNWVTASRFQAGLQALGHRVAIVEIDPTAALPESAVLNQPPDAALLLHAYRSGQPWLKSPAAQAIPFAVCLTGTDIHQGLDLAEQRPVIREILHKAGAILSQNPLTVSNLVTRFPEWAQRIHYLPPGILLGSAPYDLRRHQGIAAEAVLFLHPAGVRPVKGNLELLDLFEPVAAANPNALLAFCGPLLEPAYAARLLRALESRPWARYLGEIPPAAMAAAMRQSDIVCNNSSSEGLPNSLLEAASLGRPMLVRRIEGNLAVVQPGRNGLCFESAGEFQYQARALANDPALRNSLSHPHPDLYRPETEAATLATICQKLLTGTGP